MGKWSWPHFSIIFIVLKASILSKGDTFNHIKSKVIGFIKNYNLLLLNLKIQRKPVECFAAAEEQDWVSGDSLESHSNDSSQNFRPLCGIRHQNVSIHKTTKRLKRLIESNTYAIKAFSKYISHSTLKRIVPTAYIIEVLHVLTPVYYL